MKTFAHFMLWGIGLSDPTTQTTIAERDCLSRYAAGRKRLVEIGVWHGVTSRRLRESMSPDGVFIAVDPFYPGRLGMSLEQIIAYSTLKSCKNGKVIWVRQTGAEAGKHFTDTGLADIDFIFIDGNHSYEGLRDDWNAWQDHLAPNGIVALHDSRSTSLRDISEAGSVKFTNEVILVDPRFQLQETVDSLTVLTRT